MLDRLPVMGTIVENETVAEATELLNRAYAVPSDDYRRVYTTAKFDLRSGPPDWLEAKARVGEAKPDR